MERSRKNSARPIPATTRKPRTPVTTVLAAGAAATMVTGSPFRDAGEQVVLRQFSIHHRPGEVIVLGGPRRLLDLQRAGEPGALGVDLGGVGDQGLVADAEEVGARKAGGDLQLRPAGRAGLGIPALEPFGVRRLQPAPLHLLVQR